MKQRIFSIIALLIICGWGMSIIFAQSVPSFDINFAGSMTKADEKDWTALNPEDGKIKGTNTLEENLKTLLLPKTGTDEGYLGKLLQYIAIAVVILYLVWAGAQLVISGNKAEDLKTALRNLWFIALGSLFIYGAGRLFGKEGIIDFGPEPWVGGTQGLEGVSTKLIDGNTSFFFQILSLVKGAAFFYAILMIVVTGFKVISAADGDKAKKLVRGVLNIVAALAIMKGVDLIYFMAHEENFATRATELILKVAKFFGYLYGFVAILMVFYAGYSFLTDGGGENGMKRAKNILINLLVSGLVLFGFLLILYQVFAEFT